MSSIPEGATHWRTDVWCIGGIRYYRIQPGRQYQFFGPLGVWVNGGVSGDYPRVPIHPVSDELPPAGTVCEAKHPAAGQWCKVKILADKEPGSPHRACRDENDLLWWASEFRPIQPTAEQVRSKACDEMFGVILSLPEDRRHNRSDICEALYDAGYKKP